MNRWDETFTLDFPEGVELEIVLYDHDKGFISNSREYMGSCKVCLYKHKCVYA